jgi:hypothetical protein
MMGAWGETETGNKVEARVLVLAVRSDVGDSRAEVELFYRAEEVRNDDL